MIVISGLGKTSLHFQVNAFANFIAPPLVLLATSKDAKPFASITKIFHFPLFSDSKKSCLEQLECGVLIA